MKRRSGAHVPAQVNPGRHRKPEPPLRETLSRRAVLGALPLLGCVALTHPAPAPGSTLYGGVADELLPALSAGNALGLGVEALSVSRWLTGRNRLILDGSTLLDDRKRERLKLSSEMAMVLARAQTWYALRPRTEAAPVSTVELSSAALAESSVEKIETLFAESIRRGLWLGDLWLVPEIGGEATLDEALDLPEAPDEGWALTVQIAGAITDPDALRQIRDEDPELFDIVDEHSQLRLALERHRLGMDAGLEGVMNAARLVVRNAPTRYSIYPASQLRLIVSRFWKGRYVGRWHTHSPKYSERGWSGGDVPSFDDMANAARDGQFLTIAFQPDGFDFYDASRIGESGSPDLRQLVTTQYRSRAWRERFTRRLPVHTA